MNLQALQYIDISNAIEECIRADEHVLNSSLVQRIQGSGGERNVVVESSGYSPAYQSSGSGEGSRSLYLRAKPIFSNSLLSTEIGVTLADSALYAGYEGENHVEFIKSGSPAIDVPINTDFYYRLLDPLPEYLGAQLYRQGRQIVLILDNPTKLEKADTSLIFKLQNLPAYSDSKSRSCSKAYLSCFVDSNSLPFDIQMLPFVGNEKVRFHKITNPWHRLNVIGKSDIVFCDASGVAVDAIRSSVPVAFVGEVPSGYEKIQESIESFLQHRCRDQLLVEQQLAINDIRGNCEKYSYVMSNQSTLHSLIADVKHTIFDRYLSQSANSTDESAAEFASKPANSLIQKNDVLILNTQHTLCNKTTSMIKLKSSLASSRRKYQKFRESPVRFMEESQSSVLRYLAMNRIS